MSQTTGRIVRSLGQPSGQWSKVARWRVRHWAEMVGAGACTTFSPGLESCLGKAWSWLQRGSWRPSTKSILSAASTSQVRSCSPQLPHPDIWQCKPLSTNRHGFIKMTKCFSCWPAVIKWTPCPAELWRKCSSTFYARIQLIDSERYNPG